MFVDTVDGTVPALGAENPATCSASASVTPICGCGSFDQAKVPYAPRSGSDSRSATVTGTGLTCVGAKICATLAEAVAMTARVTANASTAIGRRADWRRIGRRKPKRGCLDGASLTRL